MTAPLCRDCTHYALINGHDRCKRRQAMRSGRLLTIAGGFSCAFERDGIPEPQRADGDKCGPDGRHFVERTQ